LAAYPHIEPPPPAIFAFIHPAAIATAPIHAVPLMKSLRFEFIALLLNLLKMRLVFVVFNTRRRRAKRY
jgi:hypothetical protein